MKTLMGLLAGLCIFGAVSSQPPEPTPVERGRKALTTKAYNPAIWQQSDYDRVWKAWGLKEKPADFPERFRERYGLHPAPFENQGLPMGLREAKGLLGKGITTDCMICHGSSIFGQSYIGLGNASLDLEALFEEMFNLQGRNSRILFPFANVRGTNEAAAMAVYLFSIRDENLKLRKPVDLGLRADLCEDVPAWWHLKKKKTMYADGGTDARSVRALMQFTLSPLATLEQIQKMEPDFKDIQQFIRSIEPPKYPFPIDQEKATVGKQIFQKNCAQCHGTYGEHWTYPNKIVPLEKIGTDPTRATGLTERAKEHYDRTWFGQETDAEGKRLVTRLPRGYQAPPLDGIWATAPYFHNGSVPTVYDVLNSATRPKLFTRSFRTHKEDYDQVKLGWKVTELREPPTADQPAIERRKVYDTTQPGRGNQGHTFGDSLTDEERFALIEYLKTL
jgi:hypothetical protein